MRFKSEVRREQILATAERLFGEKGYEATTISDLLEATGIARGTLYHHFKSKEAVMDALVERLSQRLIARVQAVAAETGRPVMTRLLDVIGAMRVTDEGSLPLLRHLHLPQNALLHKKTQQAVIQGVTPVLAQLVGEGVQQGLFKTPYPYECMEMVVIYADTAFDSGHDSRQEVMAQKIDAFVYHLQLLLGVTDPHFRETLLQVFAR